MRTFSVYLLGVQTGVALMMIMMIIIITGCASTPTKAFNAEDKQDGPCYATLGGGIGYCNK